MMVLVAITVIYLFFAGETYKETIKETFEETYNEP